MIFDYGIMARLSLTHPQLQSLETNLVCVSPGGALGTKYFNYTHVPRLLRAPTAPQQDRTCPGPWKPSRAIYQKSAALATVKVKVRGRPLHRADVVC